MTHEVGAPKGQKRLSRGRKPPVGDVDDFPSPEGATTHDNNVAPLGLGDTLGPVSGGLRPRLGDAAPLEPFETTDSRVQSAMVAGIDQEFTTDQAVVEQILFNLVDNAAKYARDADDRRIHVNASRNGQFVKLVVRDHGPGIKDGLWSRRMQPFGKSAQESADSAPGVGLGLALCRRLARQLGGSLDVGSTADGGASVTLLLPLT